MEPNEDEEKLLRSAALQNARSISLIRRRAEQEIIQSKGVLERKTQELAHFLAMMRATMEATPDGILVTDENGKITAFNEKFVQMWRVPPEIMDSWEHKPAQEAASHQLKDPRQFLSRIEEINASWPAETFDLLEFVDGRVFERHSKVQRIEERIVGRVWIFRDITEQFRAQETRSRLAAIVESSDDAIVSKTLDGIITTWNKGAEQMFGYSAEEIIGKSITVLISPHRLDEEPAIIERLKRGERIEHYETVRMRKNGTFINVSLTVSPVKDASGKIIGASKIARDITERKQTEESLRQQREWFEVTLASIGDAVITTDTNMRVTFLNPVAQKLTGWPAADAVGTPIGEVLHIVKEATRETAPNPVHAALEEGIVVALTHPTMLVHRDGSETPIEESAAPIKSLAGEILGAVTVFHDIGERREKEIALEQANQAKDQFIATLSHELRTPLTPVLALLSSLCEESTLPIAIRQDLETARRNVEMEARLVDDLLDITRIARGKLELRQEAVRIDQAVEDAINACRPDLEAKHLTLRLEIKCPEETIFADSARITQILWNLLKNSIKFTPEGGTITIRSRARRGEVQQVTIEVQDTGIGIEPGDLNRVFEAFEQGDRSITRKFGGLGLGLAISRAIAEAHGGQLGAISEGKGHGSTFSLTLPLRGAEATGSSQRAPASEQSATAGTASPVTTKRPQRILLVEDHADTAKTLGTLLSRAGFLVSTAGDATSALKLVATQPFDLLICDLGLPDISGYELMRQVRDLHSIPGIALSGYGMEENTRKCQEAGFSVHLVKPVRMAQLEEAINRIIGCQ